MMAVGDGQSPWPVHRQVTGEHWVCVTWARPQHYLEEEQMLRLCAWCGKELSPGPFDVDAQKVITHGVCDECAYHLIAQMGMPLREYLDGIGMPILVVNGAGTVETANAQARTLLHKSLPEIEGLKGGDVFECTFARLPEGCGRTVHCTGCTIRRTVMHTHDTGQSQRQVPAILNWQNEGEVQQIPFLISTERVGNVVLLRIDQTGNPA
jgi:PAS domain-containing protein